jgi:drug/metabolite transporter (DMT)-like permease
MPRGMSTADDQSRSLYYYGSMICMVVITILFAPFVAILAVPEACAHIAGTSLRHYLPKRWRKNWLTGAFLVLRGYGMLLIVLIVGASLYYIPAGIVTSIKDTSPIQNPLFGDYAAGGMVVVIGVSIVVFGIVILVYRYVFDA